MHTIHNAKDITPAIKEAYILESNAIEGIFPKTILIGTNEEEAFLAPRKGHKKGLELVLTESKRTPQEKDILILHQLLGNHLLKEPGKYRTVPAYIRSQKGYLIHYEGTLHYRQIPKQMKLLVKNLQEKQSMKQLLKQHYHFEMIHPFVDINGRVGRLLLNWTTLLYHEKLIIFNYEERQQYYNQIRTYKQKFTETNSKLKFYKEKTRFNPFFLT